MTEQELQEYLKTYYPKENEPPIFHQNVFPFQCNKQFQ